MKLKMDEQAIYIVPEEDHEHIEEKPRKNTLSKIITTGLLVAVASAFILIDDAAKKERCKGWQ